MNGRIRFVDFNYWLAVDVCAIALFAGGYYSQSESHVNSCVAADPFVFGGVDLPRRINSEYHSFVGQVERSLSRIQDVGDSGHHQPYRVVGRSCVTKGDLSFRVGDEFRLPKDFSWEEEEWIHTAGEMRITNSHCVEMLLNRITKLANVPILSRLPNIYLLHRPSFDALVKIGEPACDIALDRLRVEEDAEARLLIVSLLVRCRGTESVRKNCETIQSRLVSDSAEFVHMEKALAILKSDVSIENQLKEIKHVPQK